MKNSVILIFSLLPLVYFSQHCNFNYYNKKGGHYLFSTYYKEDMRIPRDGVCEIIENGKIYEKRVFKKGLLVEEELNFFNQYQSEQKRIRTKMNHYPILGNELGTLEEWNEKGILVNHWRFYLDKDKRRRSIITEYHHHGPLRFRKEYAFIKLSEIDSFHLKEHPPHTIDEFGYTSLIVPYGKHEEFDEKGQLIREKYFNKLSTYNQDAIHLLDGPSREFHQNGKLKSMGTYNEGNLDSSWISYHYNGQEHEKGTYRHNLKVGNWEVYNDKGRLIQLSIHDENAINPFAPIQETTWNDAGIKLEEKYIDKENRRILMKWNENGKMLRHAIYSNGTQSNWNNQNYLLFEKLYFDNIQLKSILNNLPNADTNFVSYFQNGQMEQYRHGYWKETTRHDQYKKWSSSGILLSEQTSTNRLKEVYQLAIQYYNSGGIKLKVEINNNLKIDEYYSSTGILFSKKEYLENRLHGKLVEIDTIYRFLTTGYYDKGIRNGEWRIQNSNGTIIYSKKYKFGCTENKNELISWDKFSSKEQKEFKLGANTQIPQSAAFKSLEEMLLKRDSIAYWLGMAQKALEKVDQTFELNKAETPALIFQLPQVYYIGLERQDTSNTRVKSLLHILDSMNWKLDELKLENGVYQGEIKLKDYFTYYFIQKYLGEHVSFFYQKLEGNQRYRGMEIDYPQRSEPSLSITEMQECYARVSYSENGQNAQLIIYSDGQLEFENRYYTWKEWNKLIENAPRYPKMFRD
ncbi:MAG: toxin-antitoxin system YwqK family antitoxin [Bacteroidota bacterium]